MILRSFCELELEKRKKVGKRLSILGLAVIAISIILGSAMSVAAGYGASSDILSDSLFYLTFTTIIGIFLLIIGVMAYIFPEKESRTYIWSMKSGPFK